MKVAEKELLGPLELPDGTDLCCSQSSVLVCVARSMLINYHVIRGGDKREIKDNREVNGETFSHPPD